MQRIRLLSVLIILLNCRLIHATSINITDFGAFPNDELDDTAAVQSCIDKVIRDETNATIEFQSGTYIFTSTIWIKNAINLTIMGQGMDKTVLIGTSSSAIFSPSHCNGLTITLLAIDFDPLPFTAGFIINTTHNYIDLKVIPPHGLDEGRQVSAILRYDPGQRRPSFGSSTYEIYQTPPLYANTSRIDIDVLRIPLSSPSKFVVGDAVVVRYYFGRHAVDCEDIIDFNIRSLTIYTSWAMGLVTLRARRLNIVDFHVVPRDGRWMSTSMDCIHLSDSREYIKLLNSKCEAQGDDGLNVHAFYFTISEVINSTSVIITELNWLDVLNVGIGTRLVFSTSQKPFTPYSAVATVASTMTNGPTSVIFTFTAPVNVSVGDWVSVDDAPSLTVKNFSVSNSRARGILVKTRNVEVSDCVFNATSGPAILLEPSLYWHESIAAQNVTLSRNMYVDCNQGIAAQNGVISFAPNPIQFIPIFSNITVRSSNFRLGSYNPDLMQINNGEHVSIEGNYIEIKTSARLISICNSRNVSAYNNTVIHHQYFFEPYYYDSINPCQTDLSSSIDLPRSSFNSSFPPPALP